jgi:hypothetical protein
MIKDYSFDIKLNFKGKDVVFYNYPFTASLYPVRNRQVIKAHDSISVNLQSPIAFYLKDANVKNVDSILQLARGGKFSLIFNLTKDADYIIGNNIITYDVVPISDKCFFPVSM